MGANTCVALWFNLLNGLNLFRNNFSSLLFPRYMDPIQYRKHVLSQVGTPSVRANKHKLPQEQATQPAAKLLNKHLSDRNCDRQDSSSLQIKSSACIHEGGSVASDLSGVFMKDLLPNKIDSSVSLLSDQADAEMETETDTAMVRKFACMAKYQQTNFSSNTHAPHYKPLSPEFSGIPHFFLN